MSACNCAPWVICAEHARELFSQEERAQLHAWIARMQEWARRTGWAEKGKVR